jgi:hypothetical protein
MKNGCPLARDVKARRSKTKGVKQEIGVLFLVSLRAPSTHVLGWCYDHFLSLVFQFVIQWLS